jgi:hypothetical protein
MRQQDRDRGRVRCGLVQQPDRAYVNVDVPKVSQQRCFGSSEGLRAFSPDGFGPLPGFSPDRIRLKFSQ